MSEHTSSSYSSPPVGGPVSETGPDCVGLIVQDLVRTVARLQKVVGVAADDTGEPSIYRVVDQGKSYGPLNKYELAPWLSEPVDLLFDTTRSELIVRRLKSDKGARIELGPHCGRAELSSVLETLRILAERPGNRISRRMFERLSGRNIEDKTLVKYVERIRNLIHDPATAASFIITDRGAEPSASDGECAYYANPSRRWRVIRYVE